MDTQWQGVHRDNAAQGHTSGQINEYRVINMNHSGVPYIGTYNEYLTAGGKASQQAYNANVQNLYGRAAPTVQGQGFLTQNIDYNPPAQNQPPSLSPYYSVSPQPTAPASIADAGLALAARLQQQPQNNQMQGGGAGFVGGAAGIGMGLGAKLLQDSQMQSRLNRASMYSPLNNPSGQVNEYGVPWMNNFQYWPWTVGPTGRGNG